MSKRVHQGNGTLLAEAFWCSEVPEGRQCQRMGVKDSS